MPGPYRRASEAQLERERAFARVSRVRGWLIAGAAGLTAAGAGIVAASAPGRTLHRNATANAADAAASARSVYGQVPPDATASQLGVGPSGAQGSQAPASSQPPAQPASAPAPTSGAGAVVSGGS